VFWVFFPQICGLTKSACHYDLTKTDPESDVKSKGRQHFVSAGGLFFSTPRLAALCAIYV
jgi:hypothetical protein